MSEETSSIATPRVSVPAIVITEPSPLPINGPPIPASVGIPATPVSTSSIPDVDKSGSVTDTTPKGEPEKPVTSECSVIENSPENSDANRTSPPKQSAPEPEMPESEFLPAEECTACVIPMPEPRLDPDQVDPTTESSESDTDEFRTSRCCNTGIRLERFYEYVWNNLESRYALPFWIILMSLPVSAGIMGAIYMFSCPAAVSLPNMVFMIGISLMAVLTLRVCIIIHRMTWEDNNSRSMLQTMNLICFFITALFYITESVTFWQMKPSPHSGAPMYCHPTFTSYSFWWNIATSVLMVVFILFPIA